MPRSSATLQRPSMESPQTLLRRTGRIANRRPSKKFRVGDRVFAVEHTRIESFEEQIAGSKRLLNLVAPLESELPGLLPSGHYDLILPAGAAGSVPGRNVEAVRKAIAVWVVGTAPRLALRPDDEEIEDPVRSVTAQPPGVPFEVTLQRTPSEGGVVIYASGFIPPELEHRRRERVRKALDAKLPKLLAAKHKFGATSILALESDDIALANRALIGVALVEELRGRSDAPDWIYLFVTDRPLVWRFFVLKRGEEMFPRVRDGGPHLIGPRDSAAEG